MNKNVKPKLRRQKGNRTLPPFSNDFSENQINETWVNPNLVDDKLKAELAKIEYQSYKHRTGVPKLQRTTKRILFVEPDDYDAKKFKNRVKLLNQLLKSQADIKDSLLDAKLRDK